MSGRDFMRERGLADDMGPVPVPQPAPFRFDPRTGGIVAEPGETTPPPPVGLPDDYAARVLALELATRLSPPITSLGVRDAAHAFHAFLTATEPPPRDKSTFTDE